MGSVEKIRGFLVMDMGSNCISFYASYLQLKLSKIVTNMLSNSNNLFFGEDNTRGDKGDEN